MVKPARIGNNFLWGGLRIATESPRSGVVMVNSSWIDGKNIPINELCGRYNLPRDEAQSFLSSIRIYPRDAEIISEGDADRMLFVLRHGTVDVYKQVSPAERKHIAAIEALNIFGELALVNDQPRNASIVARSDEVLVYAVGRPNLSVILANPRWAEMLVTRLSRDLAQATAHVIQDARVWEVEKAERRQLEQQLEQARNERQQLLTSIARAFAVLLEFQKKIQEHAVVGSRGWAYLRALNRVTHAIIQNHIPSIAGKLPAVDAVMLQPYLANLYGTREFDQEKPGEQDQTER